MNCTKPRNKRKSEPVTSRYLMEATFKRTLTEEEVISIQSGKREIHMKVEITTEKDPKRFIPVMTAFLV